MSAARDEKIPYLPMLPMNTHTAIHEIVKELNDESRPVKDGSDQELCAWHGISIAVDITAAPRTQFLIADEYRISQI